ncbi:DNA-binding transcriptional regulator, MarR family [Nonomuraea solani]|uniref:DNA-binding transcriptional regulator, MarR family n=1 Tax=Nonomuraea solani TaxID=1144553 RepID=A0A1H5VW87_9ACTN|nr:MarR family transcriptional regulator [Nonomuraea solani]SEF91504.1 DNA-binding transcriptional regulator, MarR family [Nonomuraea solani]
MDKPTDLIEYETMLLGQHRHVDRSAYILLSRIRMAGMMSIGQLSEAFGLDVSTLNRHTSALLRAGLAERIADPGGGIARKFRLSEAGERYLDSERARHISGLEKVLAGWTPDEVASFAAYLRRFNTDVERLGGRSWPRPG